MQKGKFAHSDSQTPHSHSQSITQRYNGTEGSTKVNDEQSPSYCVLDYYLFCPSLVSLH